MFLEEKRAKRRTFFVLPLHLSLLVHGNGPSSVLTTIPSTHLICNGLLASFLHCFIIPLPLLLLLLLFLRVHMLLCMRLIYSALFLLCNSVSFNPPPVFFFREIFTPFFCYSVLLSFIFFCRLLFHFFFRFVSSLLPRRSGEQNTSLLI